MEVSFIVPVYNVQDYIFECITSLLEVKGIEYEILVIDDGSTDSSMSIIQPLMNNPVLKVFHQENRGLSYARNVGIRHAKGRYIAFVDSDDKIDNLAFEQLYKKGDKTNAEIITGDFLYWRQGLLAESGKSLYKTMILNGKDLLCRYYKAITSITCRNLYKRDFLLANNLFFVEGIYFEDVEWMPRVYYQAKKVAYFNISFYCYRQREESITTSEFSLKKFKDCLCIAYLHLDLCRKIEHNLRPFFRNNAFYCLYKAIFYYQYSMREVKNEYIQRLRPLIASEGSVWMKLFISLYQKHPVLLFNALHRLKKRL